VTADRSRQAFATIVDPIHVQAMAAQFSHNFPGGHGVVFDGQDAGHRASLLSGSLQNEGILPRNPRGLLN
jgi:hypothetical protein